MILRRPCIALLLLALLLPGHAAARAAGELAITPVAFTSGAGAAQPSVAVDPREGFVVTWQEREGDRHALFFAVVDRDGRERRRGRIAEGRNWFVNWADFPSLAVLDNGDWVTFWLQKVGGSPYAYEIRVVRSSDRGVTWSEPVVPHDDGTLTQHGFVSLAALERDRVLVAWLDGRHGAAHGDGHDEDGPMSLRSAVLDGRGAVLEQTEVDASTCSCCQTDMARHAGRTLLVYRDRSAQEVRDIAVVERTAAGRWSAPRLVHQDGWRIEACPVNGPAIAADERQVLVAWPTLAAPPMQVRYAFARAGRFSAPTVLDAGSRVLGRVDAAPWSGGRFLVSWLGEGATARESGLHLVVLSPAGEVLGRSTVAQLGATRMAGNPRIAAAEGRALIAWVASAEGGGTRVALALVR
jgi:hypothetical protein